MTRDNKMREIGNLFISTFSQVFLILIVIFSYSHESVAEKRTMGFKIGINIASLHNKDENLFNKDFKTGLRMGAFYIYPINRSVSVQPEILYSMKGEAYQWRILADHQVLYSGKDITSIDYLEIPLLIKIAIPIFPIFRTKLLIGPSFAIKLRSRAKSIDNGKTHEYDLKEIKRSDIGITVGGEFKFFVFNKEIMLDTRFILGLSVIEKARQYYDPKTKNLVFSILIGYAF